MTRPALFRTCVVTAAIVVALAVAGIWEGTARLDAQSSQQLYLTVLDQDGQPVTDLRPYEVNVMENGVRREVLYLARPGGPADISLLVDTSGAVVPATTHVRNALSAFVDTLNGHARMSLVTFGDLPVRVVAPTTDMTRLQEAIDGLFPTEDAISRFQDALVNAAIDVSQRQPSRPAIVILASDQPAGAFAEVSPNTSTRPVDQVIGALQSIGAPVHIIALRSRESFDVVGRGVFDRQSAFSGRVDNNIRNSIMARETRDWLEVFETVSQRTGGRLSNLYASAGLDKPLVELANEILGQYIITYSRPAGDLATETLEIGVGIAREDVTVRVTPVM